VSLTAPWIVADDIIGDDAICPTCVTVEQITPAIADAACELASAVLYEMSGRKWSGVTSQTVRPAARPRTDPAPPDPRVTSDHLFQSVPPGWHESWGWYEWDDVTDRAARRAITLGFYPLVEITDVTIDGAVLDPAAYRVDEARYLVRQDGRLWPCRQDWWLPDGEPDTWSVTFDYGVAAPNDARTVAAYYACELARSMCGMECQLPARTQSITRQGVSQVLFDPLDLVADGMVGLPMVDTWVKAINPNRRRRRARIVSPDVPRRVRYG
jgi:hypothetical protein